MIGEKESTGGGCLRGESRLKFGRWKMAKTANTECAAQKAAAKKNAALQLDPGPVHVLSLLAIRRDYFFASGFSSWRIHASRSFLP